jgi:hypothetical protein
MASRVNIETRKAVIALRTAGVSNVEVAKRFHLHAVTTSRIFCKVREAVQKDAASEAEELASYARNLRENAYRAVEAGLKDLSEPHMAARLGVQVLRGFGEFERDESAVNVSVQTLVSNSPPGFKKPDNDM